MNCNLVGSIYGTFFIKIAHFVPKLTDDRRRTPSDGKSLHCLKQLKQTCSIHVYANMANIDKSKLKINPLFPH
jgi:hypothetical protein